MPGPAHHIDTWLEQLPAARRDDAARLAAQVRASVPGSTRRSSGTG
ncbi:hypothetical protein [Jiangella alba]|uniref:Uncharacterized protein n=1 Tax=Jiangella alba TaxID=561176 RepID=A0A1H5PPT5_9ACTN|nr:hypothetical protein [Jiangella alba]SEF15816.1 hypothetical protein SAMN04488561_5088 [Jiangella alba]